MNEKTINQSRIRLVIPTPRTMQNTIAYFSYFRCNENVITFSKFLYELKKKYFLTKENPRFSQQRPQADNFSGLLPKIAKYLIYSRVKKLSTIWNYIYIVSRYRGVPISYFAKYAEPTIRILTMEAQEVRKDKVSALVVPEKIEFRKTKPSKPAIDISKRPRP